MVSVKKYNVSLLSIIIILTRFSLTDCCCCCCFLFFVFYAFSPFYVTVSLFDTLDTTFCINTTTTTTTTTTNFKKHNTITLVLQLYSYRTSQQVKGKVYFKFPDQWLFCTWLFPLATLFHRGYSEKSSLNYYQNLASGVLLQLDTL